MVHPKASACPLWSRTLKQGAVSSTVHGGGKRRGVFTCLGEIVSQRVSPVSASSPCAAPIAPILLGLSLYGRRGRVLDLEPVVDPTGAIGRAEALRHDAFATERAGVLENGRAVALVMLIERDPVAGVSEQIGEHGLAVLDRLPPEVLAVEFSQVESTEYGGLIVLPIADQIED